MLVLTRNAGQSIKISEESGDQCRDIWVKVWFDPRDPSKIKIGIDAPKCFNIAREEILERYGHHVIGE